MTASRSGSAAVAAARGPGGRRGRHGRPGRRARRARWAGASARSAAALVPLRFVVPALLVYAVVVIYPSVAGAAYAFTDWSGLGAARFVGLDNFVRLLGDGEALGSVRNTVVLAVSLMVVQSVVGLLLALALHTRLRSRNLLRTLFFAPAVLPPVVIGFLWQYLYTPDGPLDSVLGVLHLDVLRQNWLGSSSFALWSIVIAVVWQHAGLSMVIFLAGLQSVPPELHEAAAIDGAGTVRRFRHVTWPLLAPATTVATVLTLIGGLKMFDQVFVMTGGGPGYATETLSLVMYKQAFLLNHYGYGTAIALVLTMIVAFFVLVQLKTRGRYEVDG